MNCTQQEFADFGSPCEASASAANYKVVLSAILSTSLSPPRCRTHSHWGGSVCACAHSSCSTSKLTLAAVSHAHTPTLADTHTHTLHTQRITAAHNALRARHLNRLDACLTRHRHTRSCTLLALKNRCSISLLPGYEMPRMYFTCLCFKAMGSSLVQCSTDPYSHTFFPTTALSATPLHS